MRSRTMMDSMIRKYNKQDILERVKANKEAHKSEYDKAMLVYRKRLVDILEDKARRVKEGKDISHRIDLEKPVHYLKEYEIAIDMLDSCLGDDIELSMTMFAQLARDEWDWKEDFESVTMSYNRM